MTSLSELATQAFGRVENFRQILDFNPQELPFELPPQIEAGIDRASEVLNIPSTDDLRQLAAGKIEDALGGIRSRVTEALDLVEENKEDVLEVISRIDWLL